MTSMRSTKFGKWSGGIFSSPRDCASWTARRHAQATITKGRICRATLFSPGRTSSMRLKLSWRKPSGSTPPNFTALGGGNPGPSLAPAAGRQVPRVKVSPYQSPGQRRTEPQQVLRHTDAQGVQLCNLACRQSNLVSRTIFVGVLSTMTFEAFFVLSACCSTGHASSAPFVSSAKSTSVLPLFNAAI